MLRRIPMLALTGVLVAAMMQSAAASDVALGQDRDAETTGQEGYGALGANFNQNLDSVDFRELKLSGTQWVRGFFPMPAADDGDPVNHFAIRKILEIADRGFETILSLKFPYNNSSFPAPGSPEMAAELARLDRVLPTVMGQVDIITIGNEPFIESLPAERDERLNVFYETVARHVIDYRSEHCGAECETLLYMGALNRLDLANRRTPAAERWMAFVRETPEIEGVDIHLHLPDPARAQAFLDYILPRMRPDQMFLVTEFSLVWYWQRHLEDTVSPEFAERYGFEADAKVWEVVASAIENPFSERQWRDFLTSSEWFMAQSDFMRDQMALYRDTGRLAVATYGFRQDKLMVENFSPQKAPWLFNSVFAPYTVQPRGEGMAAPGYWLEEFRALQQH